MKIDKNTVISVLVALVVFKVVDSLFLDKALAKILPPSSYDSETFDASDPDFN